MGPNGEEVKILSVQKSEIEKERAGKNKDHEDGTIYPSPTAESSSLKVRLHPED
jgi:hypothetical protein